MNCLLEQDSEDTFSGAGTNLDSKHFSLAIKLSKLAFLRIVPENDSRFRVVRVLASPDEGDNVAA